MGRNRFTQPIPLIAGLLVGLLFAIAAVPLVAQPVNETRSGRGFGPAYDAAHEIVVDGTVQQVVTKHALGSAVGIHLMVSGAEGMLDAHVGSFLSKETQEALHTGLPLQLVGAMHTMNGKQFMLVRQMNIGGRIITVRNKNGFLVHESARRPARSGMEKKSAVEVTGGAR